MMVEHFNGLTPAQAERFAMLAEECGETTQAVGKILRHGLDNYHPDDPTKLTNRLRLVRELIDLMAVVLMMEEDLEGVLDADEGVLDAAIVRKRRFSHHQHRGLR